MFKKGRSWACRGSNSGRHQSRSLSLNCLPKFQKELIFRIGLRIFYVGRILCVLVIIIVLAIWQCVAWASTSITHHTHSRQKKTTEIKETYAQSLTPFWTCFRLGFYLLHLLPLFLPSHYMSSYGLDFENPKPYPSLICEGWKLARWKEVTTETQGTFSLLWKPERSSHFRPEWHHVYTCTYEYWYILPLWVEM